MISIIVPIYNSSKYLRRCLDSILIQTFLDYELILINDGSTDNSGQICDDYAKQDERIKVFHKINEGVSAARNLGISKALGEWICFVDSDDVVYSNYLEDFQSKDVVENVDIIIQGLVKKYDDSEHLLHFENQVIKGDNYYKLFEELKIFDYGYAVAKLFKTNIIRDNDLSFPKNISLAEDLLFLLTYIHYCKTLHFVDKENYIYFIQEGTLSNTKKKPIEYFNRYFQYKNILKQFYKPVFNQLAHKQYQSLGQSLGAALYVSIESLYGNYALPRKQRLMYLKKIDNEDLELLNYHNYKKQNLIFRVIMKFSKMKITQLSDFLFLNYFYNKNLRRRFK